MLFGIIAGFAAHFEACHDWHLPNPASKTETDKKMRILHKTESFISLINYGSPACPHSSTAIVPWTKPVATPPTVPGRSHRFGGGVRWWRSPGKLCQHLRAPQYTKPTWCPVDVSFLPTKGYEGYIAISTVQHKIQKNFATWAFIASSSAPTPNVLTCTGLSRYTLRVSWVCAVWLVDIKQRKCSAGLPWFTHIMVIYLLTERLFLHHESPFRM